MSSNNTPETWLGPPKPASSKSQSKRRPGRVFKIPQRSSSSRSDRTSRSRSGPYDRPSNSPRPTRSHTPIPRTRMLSMLEALPAEVIEQIFLHSLNLNLPRASPFLSRVLSREHMYRTLILLAFWDDSSSYPGSATISQMMVGPLEYVPLSLEDRTRLQKEIFKCKWLTMERVREQVPKMQILTIHRQWINAGIVVDKEQQSDFENFLARKTDRPRVFHGRGPRLDRLIKQIVSPCVPDIIEGPNATRDRPHSYNLVIEPMISTNISLSGLGAATFPALNLVDFPEHLLRGRRGFSSEDVAFMEMLRMTSANWHAGTKNIARTSHNRSALHEGIKNAIRTQNYSAMLCLLKLDEHFMHCHREAQGSQDNHMIPKSHFLEVIRTGRDKPHLNLAFFEALLRASAESIPVESSELTEWIVDNVNLAKRNPTPYNLMNGRFARWLSDWQMRLPGILQRQEDIWAGEAYGEPDPPLFILGSLTLEDSECYRFYKEVLHPHREPFGNWLEESSFQTEDYWLQESGPPRPHKT
ncbi:unnamed protein product [Penicillium salamii]|uniref:Uncharacterized protein n=1 Tax=Penicillium salamii TaxID=1612424 RepID=A0A9W4JZ60_9EURO|nr:unnamed protein product [Penicillium salamii]CAG8137763.1 unnamed protein product [Penicillium salamii]CAG8362029.1 unnamed protein product [Penicillium salamii]CAG8408151.1 unnamed protein product [Penicillium salamii]CAG8410106.1 unnamed protein product [Penicillium salamii]